MKRVAMFVAVTGLLSSASITITGKMCGDD